MKTNATTRLKATAVQAAMSNSLFGVQQELQRILGPNAKSEGSSVVIPGGNPSAVTQTLRRNGWNHVGVEFHHDAVDYYLKISKGKKGITLNIVN